MKRVFRFFFTGVFLLWLSTVLAQDITIQYKEAENLEKQFKEPEALEKYKQILISAPFNMKALIKAAELNVLLGGKEKDKNNKRLFFETAMMYAKRAMEADAKSADANYAMSMVSGKQTDIETDNKKIVALVKDVKVYAENAIAINPNHAKANYSLGKWNYEMVMLSGVKKIAVKLFYGGLPDGDLDKAILYMEKCKALEPYFIPNFLDLGKAYIENHQPAKATEVLGRLVKLPTRNSGDILMKAEGMKLLESLQ